MATNTTTRIRKTLSLRTDVVDLVTREAKRQDRKFSYIVNQLLAKEFKLSK